MIIETIKKISIIYAIIMMCSVFMGQQQFLNEVNAIDDSQYDDLIEYFNDVAISDYYIERWEQPLYIDVSGEYTEEDYATLESIVDDIESLDVMPGISINKEKSNCVISFSTLDELNEYYGHKFDVYYEEGDLYAIDLQSSEYGIYSASIGIANEDTSQEDRNYLILVCISSLIGLEYGSDMYPDSICYSKWTGAQSLSDFDYILISMLYLDKLHSGMYADEADDILRRWVKTHISVTSHNTGNNETGEQEELA